MPTPEKKAEIEKRVNELLAKYNGLKTPGFDLARFLSIQKGFLIGEQDMDDNTTGILLVNRDQKIPKFDTNQLISTNAHLQFEPDYQARRRFIVAHEYAHYCLHMKGSTIFAHRDYKHKDDPMEEEADFFARCLLMPRQQVEAILRTLPEGSTTDDKVDLIARTFAVTRKKAKQRLNDDLTEVA